MDGVRSAAAGSLAMPGVAQLVLSPDNPPLAKGIGRKTKFSKLF